MSHFSENSSELQGALFKTDDLDKTLETSENTQSESKNNNSLSRTESPDQQQQQLQQQQKSSSLNRTKSMNSSNRAQSSVSDKSTTDFNSSESINSTAGGKTHRKQHSMSNESFQQKDQSDRKLSDMSAVNRRAIKKTRVSFSLSISII